MSVSAQGLADAANDAYNNRDQSDVDNPNKLVRLDGRTCTVFGYASDPGTGFHATAYQDTATGEIIIAYRGTDPGLFAGKTAADKAVHARTTVQDVVVDAVMVREGVNLQTGAADKFTDEMLAKAVELGIPMDRIFVAGHSQGGTLAEIEAARRGLAGTTFNAYGAAGLAVDPPAPGCRLTNYVMANDVVGAANGHIGVVVPLASADDLQSLRDGRYLDAAPGAARPNSLLAMRLGDHGIGQFVGAESVLAPAKLAQYERNYVDHRSAVDHYRGDICRERTDLAAAMQEAERQGRPGNVPLPPDLQRQMDEYLAVHADPAVRRSIERNALVQGATQRLQQGEDAVRAQSRSVRAVDEQVGKLARGAGVFALPANPAAPLVGLAVGAAADWHGRAAEAAGHFVGDQLGAARAAVAQSAHAVAAAAVATVHDPRLHARALGAGNRAIGALYDELQRRLPEASENRLLQCVATCHAKGIDAENLKLVHLDEKRHAIILGSGGLTTAFATVDVNRPSPPAEQSILRIADIDAAQVLLDHRVEPSMRQPAPTGPALGEAR